MSPEFATPNSIVDKFAAGTVFHKSKVDPSSMNILGDKLPLNCNYLNVAGTGDYDQKKSSGGSIVLRYDCDIVAKIPLGNTQDNPLFKARKMMEAIKFFSGVSPKTLAIVAADENGEPKPIVLQKNIDGMAACNTPLSQLMSLDTLMDIKKIVYRMDEWYSNNKTYDLCGQKTSKTRLGRVLSFIPFFSDNIMVDNNGRAWLADNILYTKENFISKKKGLGAMKRFAMHLLPKLFINTLIGCRKTYDLFTFNNFTKKVTSNNY